MSVGDQPLLRPRRPGVKILPNDWAQTHAKSITGQAPAALGTLHCERSPVRIAGLLDTRRPLFSARDDDEFQREIYEMSLDSGEERRVAHRPEDDSGPTYSADGQWIAFESLDRKDLDHAPQIWTMRAEGTEQNQLTVCGGEDPSWSPDGTMIVYTKYLDNGSPENGILWLIDVRNRTEKQLTFHPPCDQ